MNKKVMLTLSIAALWSLHAQAADPSPPRLEEILVTAPTGGSRSPLTSYQSGGVRLQPQRISTSDAAGLLGTLPGVSLQRGGGVSSLPVVHGLADERVRVLVDGVERPSACSNHMNPPLSMIDPSQVASVQALTGLTPVSAGGDSLVGTVAVNSAPPLFAKPGAGVLTKAKASGFTRSNGKNRGGSLGSTLATDKLSLSYAGSTARAGDFTDGTHRKVLSTAFATENHTLKLAAQGDGNLATLQLGAQDIPYQDFVNAHMDMTGNESLFAKGGFEKQFTWGTLDTQVHWERTRHSMNVRGDKSTPTKAGMNMPMETEGTTYGYALKAEIDASKRDTFRVGNEYLHFNLDDWWPPSDSQAKSACNTKNVNTATCSMAPGSLWNINNGQRERLGIFAEWDARWDQKLSSLLGVRNDIVWMDADDVGGYNMNPAATGSSAYFTDAKTFNGKDHARRDVNYDLTALLRYKADPNSDYEAGYARKSRSPNLYERYSWVNRSAMSIRMNGWAGDANGYAGNLDLKPEVANTVSVAGDWHDATRKEWSFKAAPYYTHVQDFIDADRCPVLIGGNACTQSNLMATTGLVQLKYANHDARLYGMDLSGRMSVAKTPRWGDFALSSGLNYVQGKNLDTNNDLYNIMPLNGRLGLEHERDNWTSGLEWQGVDRKRSVSPVRNEQVTAGYALVNARTGYVWEKVRLDAGVDNVFDKFYHQPLGGAYWVHDWTYNNNTRQSSVPGMGRSYYLGMTVEF